MYGSRRSGSCGRNGTVQVRGYRRANGTYVAGYTRSLPRKSSSTTMPVTACHGISRTSICGSAIRVASPAANSSVKTVYVRGYTRANGTQVAGYYRSPPSKSGSVSNPRPAASPHIVNRCSSSNSVASIHNCSGSPAGPSHCPSNAKAVNVTTGHTGSMAKSTVVHVLENHVRMPPRITVKSAQIAPVYSPTCSSQQPRSTITQDSKCIKIESAMKPKVDSVTRTGKGTSPPVQRSDRPDVAKPDSPEVKSPAAGVLQLSPVSRPWSAVYTKSSGPDIAKPVVSDSPVIKPPAENISKPNTVSRPCNAVPTALVKVEAKLPLSRPKADSSHMINSTDSKKLQAKSDVFVDIKRKQHCCRTDKEVAQGSISLLASDSDEFSRVREKFRKAWAWGKGPSPDVKFIFKVTNNTLKQKWTAYRCTLIEKDIKELYHGTKLSCKITTTQKLCNIGSCGVCGISSVGLDRQYIRDRFQRFGNGFYLAPNSSKCNDYAQSCDELKAMFLCDVLPGRRFYVQSNRQHLEGPPTGYDSVYGNIGEDLKFEEQVVYKSEAVLPRYIIVYR